jgi:DNA-binding PadR family transcriptional regulator
MWAHGWGSKRHRGLRVWVLHLLERGPLNGAEVMEQMDRMTAGWWRPSPGSIYPLLEQLEQEKIIAKNPDGRYRLTEEARGGPEWMRGMGFPGSAGPRNPEDAVRELESYAAFLEDLARTEREQVPGLDGRLRAVARRLDALSRAPSDKS